MWVMRLLKDGTQVPGNHVCFSGTLWSCCEDRLYHIFSVPVFGLLLELLGHLWNILLVTSCQCFKSLGIWRILDLGFGVQSCLSNTWLSPSLKQWLCFFTQSINSGWHLISIAQGSQEQPQISSCGCFIAGNFELWKGPVMCETMLI